MSGGNVLIRGSAQLSAASIAIALIFAGLAGQASGETDASGLFDRLLNDNLDRLNRMAASGDGRKYYTFSYVMEGTLAQYEATRDTRYLEQVLVWAESMIASARVVDIHGLRNWSGRWVSQHASSPIAHQLDDLQGATALARAARLILTDEILSKNYGHRARELKRFVQHDIVEKVLEAHRSKIWYRTNAANTRELFSDKTALLVRLLLDLYRCDETERYRDLAEELLGGFTRRLVSYKKGALIWDGPGVGPFDTSHANRMPYMAVDAYESGVVIERQHIEGLARLLTEVIWDQSMWSPQFANYIDGSNGRIAGRGPWGNGQIYSGWLTLGGYDARVQLLGEATLRALKHGRLNPSLRYMDTLDGKLSLIGHLARNRRNLHRTRNQMD
jgi:hypothetical protein